LQILAPHDAKINDKQNIDKAVLELKRISRNHAIPIIGVSSLNRASYKDKISMEAFKESGGIEYASDVLIGLQFTGVGEKDFDINIAKKRDPRDIELIVIKNRNGISGACLGFKYYPKFNYFQLNKSYTSDLTDNLTYSETQTSEQSTSSKVDIVYDIKNRESLSDVLKNLDRDYVYGLDIETTGLKATSSEIALLQIYNPKDDRVYIYRVTDQPINEAEELLLSDIHFVAHNASFEKSFMPYLQSVECSMLLYHAVKSSRNCGLANLESITGISYANKKQMQTSNWRADILLTEQLEYAAKDAKATYIIWNNYKDKNPEVYRRMRLASSILDNYSKRGLPVDVSILQKLKLDKEKERDTDLKKIKDLGYESIITPKGFTTKKELIKAISPDAQILVGKVRSCNSYINNIIAGVESKIENGRLPINVLICGTETGRLSTVRPNVQNFPRQGFRHIFRAGKDCSIVKADFAGQELRMAAAISGEKVMLDAFNNGDDLHALMAAKLNDISIEDFKRKDTGWQKAERQKAKAANFGFLYGMGAKKFVNTAKDNYGVELTEGEATKIKNTFWSSYPDLRHWCLIERRKCQERGYALTLGGRKRYFADMDKAYCEQINTAIQGSAADILLETLIALPTEIEKYLINTIHDELIFEVPKHLINDVFKNAIEGAMIQGVKSISTEYPLRDIAEIQIVDTL
jgi:DNA polymerase I-like protein with 3'-5' exonuclease and polymerase domains